MKIKKEVERQRNEKFIKKKKYNEDGEKNNRAKTERSNNATKYRTDACSHKSKPLTLT